MATATVIPIPTIKTRRTFGVEVEVDSTVGHNSISGVDKIGWLSKHDGSLQGGLEYVTARPMKFKEIVKASKQFSVLLKKSGNYVGKTGSMHVHVGTKNVTTKSLFKICQIYDRYYAQIGMLLGKARQNSDYAKKLTRQHLQSFENFEQMFNMNRVIEGCYYGSDRYFCVNCCSHRKSAENRTVEFRQQSASGRYTNIAGWIAFCAALVEIACDKELSKLALKKKRKASWKSFIALFKMYEEKSGSKDIANWIVWRKNFLAPKILKKHCRELARYLELDGCHRGLYWISRTFNVNHAHARALAEKTATFGIIKKDGNKFYATPRYDAAKDLEEIEFIADMVAEEAA